MSYKVSSGTIASICQPLGQDNQEVVKWCTWMAEDHEDMFQTGETPIEDGVILDNAQNFAILGARRVFRAKMKELLKPLEDHPDFSKIMETCNSYLLTLEGTLQSVGQTIQNYMFFNIGRLSFLPEKISSSPGSRIVELPERSYEELNGFLNVTFLKPQSLLNNENGTGLSKDRMEILRRLELNPSETQVNFETWNKVISQRLFWYLDNVVLGKVDAIKKTSIIEIGAYLGNLDFTALRSVELNSILNVLNETGFSFIQSKRSARLVPMKAQGRSKLSQDEMDVVLRAVKYPGIHPLIAEPIERKVRSTLAQQLSNVMLEPKFIPQLTSVVASSFTKARVPRGHRSGMIAAMSLGEDASQAGLRSFHHAGVTGDSGFDRVKVVTDNPGIDKAKTSKNAFTIIALNGNPTAEEAALYAHKIEETRIGDVCEIVIGRTHPDVPDMHDIFGGTPVFEEDEWQQRFVTLMTKLGVADSLPQRPNFVRPDWIVRLVCDTNLLYQKRLSPMLIAEALEKAFTDIRAIASDFKTGLVDIYVNFSGVSHAKDEVTSREYTHLSLQTVPLLTSKVLQGVVGFSKAFVEKFSITPFIASTKRDESDWIVTFNDRDVKIEGVPETQMMDFLRNKAHPHQVEKDLKLGDNVYRISNYPGDLRARILSPESVSLESVVVSVMNTGDELVAVLDRTTLREKHDVSVAGMMEFFERQDGLKTFESVDIKFDREEFQIKITRAETFTPEVVAKQFEYLEVSNSVEFEKDTIIFNGVSDDLDLERFQTLVDSFGRTLLSEPDRDNGRIILKLYPLTLQGAWHMLLKVENGCKIIPTTFESRKKQRLGERYRILAKGIGLSDLAHLPFVNIYATTSSIPREHYDVFDIEACRDYIASELILNAGADVGDRHLGLISDVMCYIGFPIKLKLSGKRGTLAGPLATASMQESLRLLLDASAANATDELKSSVGMTLIGDFERGRFTQQSKTSRSEEVDSAVALLMSSTATTRTVVSDKKPTQEVKKTTIPTATEDMFEDFKDPQGGI